MANHYQDLWQARERGKLLVGGGGDIPYELLGGLGDYEYLEGEPYGATLATYPELAVRCAEAAEARGFARDLCSYCRLYLGSMFANLSPFGGFPRPDFILQMHGCDSHGKWMQITSEHLGIPYFVIDHPISPFVLGHDHNILPPDPREQQHKIDYLAGQFYDFIEWVEKVTGRKYDDEKLIEDTYNGLRCQSLWAEISTLNKAIPAPLDLKSMFSLYVLAMVARLKKETVEFYQMLCDEVRDRVENGIAALGSERCRLFHDSQPHWYNLSFFRHPEKYGAVFIGSHYAFSLNGGFEEGPDGAWVAMKDPGQLGITFKGREDTVQFLARWYMRRQMESIFTMPNHLYELLKMVEQWHVDGVVFHLNRGCEGSAMGQMECRLAVQQKGIPTMTYEGNMADPREFAESQSIDRLESFLESLGLTRLEK